MAAQRMHAIALDSEDLPDQAELRGDAGLPLLAVKSDPPGWQRIVPRCETFDKLLAELHVESQSRAPREPEVDLDATDNPLHGPQAGRFLHGHYGC